MQLTLNTDFSLRVLIQIGVNQDRLTTIREIAESFGISKNHLTKVVTGLGQKGYVDTIRGRNGGLRLTRAPQQINIGQVVRDTERLEPLDCLREKDWCVIQRACKLRGVLREAATAFITVLDQYTLADLIKPQERLALLLGL